MCDAIGFKCSYSHGEFIQKYKFKYHLHSHLFCCIVCV